MEVVVDGAPIAVGAAQQRIVLECLALRANSVVTSDFLVEALWADHAPAKPGPQLQVYVANLRRMLDPARSKGVASQRLASRSGGYVLTVTEDELDLLRFRSLVEAGELAVQAADLATGADCLREAMELFRGPVFPDLADIELFRPELDKLEESRLDVYQDLIEVELTLGRHGILVGELQSLVARQPFRERLWAALVLALYRSDRQADALAACRDARRVFIDELGIDPGPRLRQLERSVLQQDASLAAPALDGHRRIRQRLDNLPAELTPLIGRDAERDALCSLYLTEGCRLVTITGPGGTGKTRLALAAASTLGARMSDGVCWVNLAPLSEIQQVPGAIAAALGLEDWAGADPLKTVTGFLRSRRLLLVLDNFEQLEGAWPVVLDMLTAAPGLRILITSRRPLGLRAEYEYELAPLALPPLDPPLPLPLLQDVPAVKLFLIRGRAVRPYFNLDSNNAAVVSRLCRRLDGLPLAIELAAAQLRKRSERELLDDLEVSLAALPAAFRDLPDRQRTLTATIAWSYQLLGEAEQQLFDKLGVFAADPTVAAVNSIRGLAPDAESATEDLLNALAHHSLLRRYTDPAGASRVSMLHAIREFARNHLGSLDDMATVRRRHAEFYLSLAEAVSPQLWGQNQVDAFRILHADAPDLRGGLLWATGLDGSTELALRLIGQLWHYWELTGDVAEQCEIALELLARAPDAPPSLKAPALSGAATLCWMLGRHDEAARLHLQSRQAFQSAGNDQGVAWATMCLATQAAERDDTATAQRLAAEALSMPDASPRTRVAALIILSLLALYAGDHARALDLCRECVEHARPLGDRSILGNTLVNLADSTEQAGDYDTAEQLLYEALGAVLELGAQGQLVAYLESLAAVYIEQHRVEQAIRVLAAADAHRTDRGLPLFAAEQRRIESMIARARAEVGPIPFGLAWAGGQALTLTQIVNEVILTKQEESRQQEPSLEQRLHSAPNLPTASDLSPAPWA
ncbi:putative ATPase/DNA-binding SARP family transcriptional activator [Arthrobacter pascens]|uniref:BTAD domain-containing putative transcriptional regulator n=1 Tax=Arthrobacter pascens TaxID=1677 RepID=UPI002856C341|nr:BTAD domain-containing putative transcriptional regulator [Arthrobacter pascens]MDR6559794.1 putative ATPase/DNA-binding SARP family transcriptional activator [Arthrobacter pascens]